MDPKVMPREAPEGTDERKALVTKWQERVRQAKAHWSNDFARMRADMKFAAGYQWPDMKTADDDRYVANIVLRHIKHRTAGLYGKNPRAVAKRREKLLSTTWDGTMASLQAAQQQLMMAQQLMSDPFADPIMAGQAAAQAAQANAVVGDAMNAMQQAQLMNKVAKTLELLYQYSLDEQAIPFIDGMKDCVRRAVTTGVGYTKLGFQRAMARKPETERQLSDYADRLAVIERLAADIADGEIDPNAAEAEQLRLAMQALSNEPMVIVREGLDISYPDSTAIIPSPKTKRLRNFVGAPWVAEEFLLTADDIKETYQVDVGNCNTTRQYEKVNNITNEVSSFEPWSHDKKTDSLYCVWEIYSKQDGLVYVVCDGYDEFLVEPGSPDVYLERFYPWFPLVFNEMYQPGCIFPMSDVRLIRDMQLEMNRARQGLREHRLANRPKIVVASGQLDDEDREKLVEHPPNAVIELNALQPGQAVDQLLQPFKAPPIDPALYDVSAPFEDVLRVVGAQEANLGGTSGASATETSIAESSRMSGQSSDVDDLDQMLTDMARAAGQILLLEMSVETVTELVGPGAVWPETTRVDAAREIYLEIEAGSTGRPNKAAEVQNATQLAPIIMQIPGINPEWFAREMIRRLDDKLDLTDAFATGLPSMAAMNRTPQMAPGGGPERDPNQQGDQGGDNVRTEPRRPANSQGAEPPPPTGPMG